MPNKCIELKKDKPEQSKKNWKNLNDLLAIRTQRIEETEKKKQTSH